MYLLLRDAFVQRGWILGDFGPWMAYSGILPFMHSLTEGWGVKGAALYFLKLWGQHGAPLAWAAGVSLHMFSTSSHCHILWKAQKERTPPSHAEKQHRPVVTTVGFWIQYNKIALSCTPPTQSSLYFDLTLSWEKRQQSLSTFTIFQSVTRDFPSCRISCPI